MKKEQQCISKHIQLPCENKPYSGLAWLVDYWLYSGNKGALIFAMVLTILVSNIYQPIVHLGRNLSAQSQKGWSGCGIYLS